MSPEDASANSNTTRDGTLSDLHYLCDGIAAVIAVGGWGTKQRFVIWPTERRCALG
jgi:hypothetical protein